MVKEDQNNYHGIATTSNCLVSNL